MLKLPFSAYEAKCLVLKKQFDVHLRADDGKTCLHRLALDYGGARDMAEVFIEAGADVNAVDSYGKTPLDYAKIVGNRAVSFVLLKHGGRALGGRDGGGDG